MSDRDATPTETSITATAQAARDEIAKLKAKAIETLGGEFQAIAEAARARQPGGGSWTRISTTGISPRSTTSVPSTIRRRVGGAARGVAGTLWESFARV